MNNHSSLKKMQEMKLYGMIRAFKSTMETGIKNNFTADELVAHLIDAEWDDRYNRKLTRLIKAAKFRYQASIEEIDFQLNRNLDKNMILRFSDPDWIKKRQDIIITGPTGVGKSFIASALGNQGCMYGFKVLYSNCSKFFPFLKLARVDGSYIKVLNNMKKQDLIILDDLGSYPFDSQSRLALLEIMEDRHSIKSTIISSQFPVKNWHEIIGEPTIADAICDRIIHNAFRIELEGESVRKIYAHRFSTPGSGSCG